MAKKKSKRWIWVILGIIILGCIGMFLSNKNQEDEGIKVEIDELSKRDILETVTASGKIFPEKEVKISSDVSGEIVELYVSEGDTVKAGQILAKIDPDSYLSAVQRGKATLNNAKAQQSMAEANIETSRAQKEQIIAQITNAETIHSRNSQLFNDGVISQVEYDQSDATLKGLQANLKASEAGLKSSQKSAEGASYNVKSTEATLRELNTSLSRTTIKAPVDGIVSSLTVEQGERVVGTIQMAGTEMMRIANLASMLVEVEVSENDILRVSLNDSVSIEVDAYPESSFEGVVTHVSNSASNISTGLTSSLSTDQVTNFLVEVRIAPESYAKLLVPGRPHPFRPGMSATVDIFTDIAEDIVAVPIQAVTTRVPEEYKDKTKKVYEEVIFGMKGDSAVMYSVSTGIQDDEYIQLTSDIPSDLTIITGPYNAVSDELEQGEKVVEKKDEDEDDKKKKWGEDNTALIILLKNAKKGHAKTRLAKGIGIDAAHDAYLHLLAKTQLLAETTPFTVYLYYSESLPHQSARWQMQNGTYRLQSDGDLGNRMSTAFTEVLASHDKAIIMGSDCPYITQQHLDRASKALDENQVVYGPSLDGGYYLLGLKTVHSILFEEMTWSTETVLQESLARCKSADLSVAQLETLEDIDEAESWERYLNTKK